ncbi:serine carboxypeptidase S28-domain-containing protein [Crepidotus variabilis]|uniref:Serine carboxypeptidase S28-domain-containing protein n=1 Tax=Crepidotus variabilis TaxID=179855 RepID=A0A9P6E830_9AGAR|nr:serine carboxypeptidase S28-domain-containing protein [Crepidotus variabilis]
MFSALTWAITATLLLSEASNVLSKSPQNLRLLGPQGINLWKLDTEAQQQSVISKDPGLLVQESGRFEYGDSLKNKQSNMASKKYDFRARWFEQPLDHFASKSSDTFHQRYWVNTRHYKPRKGAPVIVLDGGETSGEDRLPFLDTGIVEILARATGGVGVVLEHRYYGESIPVSNFSTDALRFLNNAQAAADSANFMKHVKFDGIAEDLTAPGTPWIYYGGSYAGARAAHMKILYPDIVWGSIASSAVTHAALSNWQYMEVIRTAADPKCSKHLVNSITTIDSILSNGPDFIKNRLKGLFGLSGLKYDEDFVSVLESPLSYWQAKCWDPEFGSTKFDDFCHALSSPFGIFSAETLDDLPYEHPDRMITIEGDLAFDVALINYGKWVKKNIVSMCPKNSNVEQCFGTFDDEKYQSTSLDQDWRLWTFQVCTEWGYFTTAPPDQKQPRIISKLLTLDYESKICKQAFPKGDYFTVPNLPNITAVNALGDFGIAADRLAIIDGEIDPWRPDTPHSDDAEDREDTILRPFKLIPNGVHHYDEYGWKNLLEEPHDIRKIHADMIHFVTSWLRDWRVEHGLEVDE